MYWLKGAIGRVILRKIGDTFYFYEFVDGELRNKIPHTSQCVPLDVLVPISGRETFAIYFGWENIFHADEH